MMSHRNLLIIALGALFLTALTLPLRRAAAATRTWDGGGATNNWSEAANWSGDVVPTAGDDVIFDGTSAKNAVIDVDFSITGLQINAAYTGSITLAATKTLSFPPNGDFTMSGSSFSCGAGSSLVSSALINLNAGTLDCGAGTATFNQITFNHNGGTFIAPAGNLTLRSTSYNLASTATFNHNSGTIVANNFGASSPVTFELNGAGSAGTMDINNLTIDTVQPAPNSVTLLIRSLDTLRVLGNLNFNDGEILTGTLESHGNVTIGNNADGGNATFRLSGNATRTVTLPTGLPTFNPIILNAPNTTFTTSGTGTAQITSLVLQQGAVITGTAEISIIPIIDSASLTPAMMGGTLTCNAGGGIQFTRGNVGDFTMDGGTFDCGAGTATFNGMTFNHNGGTFIAPAGNLFFRASSYFSASTATFNHNNGTIVANNFNASSPVVFNFNGDLAGTLDINNLTIDTIQPAPNSVSLTIRSGDTLRVLGNLNFNDGQILTGTLESHGNFTIGSNADGGDALIKFSGANNQTYSNSGGSNPTGAWTVDKSGGTLTAASSLLLGTNQALDITSGRLYLNAGSNLRSGALTIGANGRLVNDSSTTITLGGNVANNGVIDLQGGGAACPENDIVLLRSTTAGQQRAWSGGGAFRLVDVDVQDMGGMTAITVFSGANSGNNSAAWTFNNDCPPTVSLSPQVVTRIIGTTQQFTGGGGFPPYAFSLPVNNSGGSINASTGLYTAGNTPNTSDTVRVTDSFGSAADATVNVFSLPTQLAITAQPGNVVAGQPFNPSLAVTLRDQFGNTVTNATNAVTLTLQNNPCGGAFSGTTTRNAVNGIATFTGLQITRACAGYTAQATSPGLTSATSNSFNVSPAAAVALNFNTQPGNTAALAAIAPPVEIEVRDAFGNRVTTAHTVTVALQSNPGNATLSGSQSRIAFNGLATFDNLSLNSPANNYALAANASGLSSATSSSFNITRPVFFVTNTNDNGSGSLRQAILDANAVSGEDRIDFNLPVGVSHTIAPNTELPIISGAVVIDGFTQPGGPPVEISGANITTANPRGLHFFVPSGGSTVKGLTINNFAFPITLDGGGGNIVDQNKFGTDVTGNTRLAPNNGTAIVISSDNNLIGATGQTPPRNIIVGRNGVSVESGSGNRILGNYIGTNAAGTAALATNTGFGIIVLGGSNNVIGGSSPTESNVIAGHQTGVQLHLSSSGSVVQGNLIGTNAGGNAALPNIFGITVSSPNNVIGGPGVGNVIAGNSSLGIHLAGSDTIVQENRIGTNFSSVPLPNGSTGVLISSSNNQLIDNEIAFNAGPGLAVASNAISGNRIAANLPTGSPGLNRRIHSNGGGLGIRLRTANDGPLPNDPGDSDTGANNRQNYPVLTLAASGSGNTNIQGSLNSTLSSNFTLHFYSSQTCDPSGFGEGETFVGSTTVTTDSIGIVGFNRNFAANVPAGHFLTATATDAQNNTSEFSQCLAVIAAPVAISGRITNTAGNTPLPNVLVQLSGSQTGRASTDRNGNYAFANLPSGGNFTVTPLLTNFNFNPARRSYTNLTANQTGQNFAGTKTNFTVSGRVLNQQLPLAGVNVNLLNGLVTIRSAVTDANGFYSFSNLMAGNYTLLPSQPNFSFTPAQRAVTLSPNDATADFTAQSLLSQLTGRITFTGNTGIKGMSANSSGLTLILPSAFGFSDLSRDGVKLVYVKTTGNGDEIFTANFDGSNEVRLTTNIESDNAPVWSADRTKIAFLRSGAIFTMNADGANQTMLPGPLAADRVSWSPDGAKLAFSSAGNIFTVNSNGGNLTPIAGNNANFPSWSPDGAKIAFVQSGSIKTMNPDGSNQTTIASGDLSLSKIAWSPDSSRVAFHRAAANGTRDLQSVNSGGGGLVTILNEPVIALLSWGATPAAATGAGANVTTQLGGATLTFANVSNAGTTTVAPIPPSSAGTAPGGFALGNIAYEITTTANFTPPVTVCFVVPDAAISQSAFNQLALLHNEDGMLVDRTTTRDFAARTICGQVTSLSPFALAAQVNQTLPTISGLVVDADNNPLSGVLVRLTGAETRVTATDSNGLFTFVNLTAGANYNVQPKQTGYLFTDYSRDVLNLTGDATLVFTGARSNFRLAGRVLNQSGNGVAGVALNLSGDSEASATTDSSGNYSFNDLPADGSYVVTPSSVGFTYAPAEITAAPLTANLDGLDFTQSAPLPPPAMQFSAASIAAHEGDAFAVVNISRAGDISVASSVDYQTGDSFAFADCAALSPNADQRCDYAAQAGSLSFAPGETLKSFAIPLTDDFYPENNEQLTLALSNPVGGSLGANATATLTIQDNDSVALAERLFLARLDGAQESPAVNTNAAGQGTVALNAAENQITVNMSFTNLGSAQTAAHVHGPAPVGQNAPVLFTLNNGLVVNQTFAVTPAQVAQLKAGLFYFNVHTQNFPNGEIRGQILPNPLESARFFVRQQYADFLSRVPDTGGFDFWTGQIAQVCGADLACLRQRRVDVSNAFFFEQEYQQTGAFVYRLYRAAYGNQQPAPNPMGDNDAHPFCQQNPQNCHLIRASHVPSYARFAADRARLDATQLAATQSSLATNFARRAEFVARYPLSQTAEQFVDALLANIQAASGANLSGQRTALLNLYNATAGGQAAQRGAVLFRLAEDNAAGNPINNRAFIDAEYNRAFVTTQYFGYLRRDADLPGLNFWLGTVNQFPLRSAASQNGMVCAFITSEEYQQRFSSYFTRANQECQ